MLGQYVHNALGQRVQKTAGGVTKHYIYDLSGHLIAEHDGADGSVDIEYGAIGDMLLGFVRTGVGFLALTDHAGRPVMSVKWSNGNVEWEAAYRPFGELLAQSGPEAINIRFPGQFEDQETGLYYNTFRTYHPALGRYLESDPIGLRAGWNTYAYAGGNPVMRVDPRGLQATTTGGIGAAPGVVPGSEGNQGLAEDLKNLLGWCWQFAMSGLPFNPGGNDCEAHQQRIEELVTELEERWGDMATDPRNLFHHAPKGPDSWKGHQDKYYEVQGDLKTQIGFAKADKCPVSARADFWSKQPAPSRPGQPWPYQG